MRKRKETQKRSLNTTQALRKPSLHDFSGMVPKRKNVVVEFTESKDFVEKLKKQLLKTTIDNCSSLFPPTFTVGDVLDVGSTFILRALANAPKESRLEILYEVYINIRNAVQKLDQQ